MLHNDSLNKDVRIFVATAVEYTKTRWCWHPLLCISIFTKCWHLYKYPNLNSYTWLILNLWKVEICSINFEAPILLSNVLQLIWHQQLVDSHTLIKTHITILFLSMKLAVKSKNNCWTKHKENIVKVTTIDI